MAEGQKQEPGGWNRVMLRVTDLPARIEALKKAGLHFRNQMEEGPGGKQVQLEDPDGNPIELFEPARSLLTPLILQAGSECEDRRQDGRRILEHFAPKE